MKILQYLSKSIGLTQAVTILFASFLIGLILSTLYLSYNLSDQRNNAIALTEDILTAAEGGATSAAQTTNLKLATDIVTSMMALTGVEEAILRDQEENILASQQQGLKKSNAFVSWFAKTFIGDHITGERKLFIKENSSLRQVGVLSVSLEPTQIANDFLTLAITIMIAGLVQAFSIGFILLWLSAKLVTSPLRRIATTIANINPERPQAVKLPVLPHHKNNELGYLLQHTQQMLEKLSNTQEQLRNLATRDPLTNRPNRTLITDRLSRAIMIAERNQTLIAVLFMDLDRFKNINDSLGHDVGDLLLIETSQRLTEILRNNDSVGRLGGDEFLIVLEGTKEISEVVRMVQRITEALSKPFFLQGHEVITSGSIGISVFPNDGKDTNTLMRCADLAMYEAKGSTARWHFFAKEMSDRVESRLKTEIALSHAVERNELLLHFQPKIETSSGNLAGCEALLRWKNNTNNLSSEDIISIAEDSGSIIEIGAWVIEQVCKQIKLWQPNYGNIPIAINVSARQLREKNFVNLVLSIIETYQVDPEFIELEITETVLLEALDECFIALGELRKTGITISIDDFGTGYSSLSYLTRLPVDTLKIDRSFVSGEQRSKAVLEMIVAMAKTLQLKTVAEGVETQGQRDWLVYEGCDYLQGYLTGKPLSAEAFENQFLNKEPVIEA
ncbi:MAG: EAL domain-containing protein [Cellvibrionaceae bacterium]